MYKSIVERRIIEARDAADAFRRAALAAKRKRLADKLIALIGQSEFEELNPYFTKDSAMLTIQVSRRHLPFLKRNLIVENAHGEELWVSRDGIWELPRYVSTARDFWLVVDRLR